MNKPAHAPVSWQSAPYAKYTSARTAEINGMRLYIKRAYKGAKYFSMYVDGLFQGHISTLDAGCVELERIVRSNSVIKFRD